MNATTQHPFILFILSICLCIITVTANAALSNDGSIRLTIDMGLGSCPLGATFPNCDAGETPVITGSYSIFNGGIATLLEGERGIMLGEPQPYNGRPITFTDGINTFTQPYDGSGTHIVKPWSFGSELGTHWNYSITATNTGNLDMTTWRATVSDLEEVNLGAGSIANTFTCNDPVGNTRVAGDCQIGDTYILDYNTSVAGGAWNGQTYSLHLEGTIISVPPSGIRFTEVSVDSGIPENTGTGMGLAWIDYDNDGDQDLFVPGPGGPSGRMFENIKNLSTGITEFVDVTSESPGLTAISLTGRGAAVGDYDGDGYDDIFVSGNLFDNPNHLLRNVSDSSGRRIFVDVTASTNLGNELKNSVSAAFGDLNGDGFLDLYVSNGADLCGGSAGPGLLAENDLYLNISSGSTRAFQKVDRGANDGSCAWASILSDFDNDGDLDIFISNDVSGDGGPAATASRIYVNNAGTFTSFQQDGWPGAHMGIAAGDFNRDGWLDYAMSDIGSGPIFHSPGRASPLNITNIGGELLNTDGIPYSPDNVNMIGQWGTVFLDVDNDGFLELYKAPGYIHLNGPNGFQAIADEPTITPNDTTEIGTDGYGAGVATADYDNDGDMDITVHASQSGKTWLFKNDSERLSGNNWLRVELSGLNPNHRGIGARVKLTSLPSLVSQIREINAGSSLSSSNDLRAHFGLGEDTSITEVEVTWPSGCIRTVSPGAVNQLVVVNESDCYLPQINRIEPLNGFEGDRVLIFGLNLQYIGEVQFNGTPSTPAFVGENVIGVDVPAGATTGPITLISNVENVPDYVSSDIFTVIPTPPLPVIYNFTDLVVPGQWIKIQGSNLQYTRTVTVNEVPAQAFVVNDTLVFVMTNGEISTGLITLTTPGGSVTTASNVTVLVAGTVSGQVKNSFGAPVAGITISMDNNAITWEQVTGFDGVFSFENVYSGLHAIRAESNDGFTFETASYVFMQPDGGNVTKDFIVTNNTLSGTITDANNSADVGGTLVKVIDENGQAYYSSPINSSGSYSLSIPSGTYEITLAKSGPGNPANTVCTPAIVSNLNSNIVANCTADFDGKLIVDVDFPAGNPFTIGFNLKVTTSSQVLHDGPTSSSDGVIRFNNVPNDTYHVQVTGYGVFTFDCENITAGIGNANANIWGDTQTVRCTAVDIQ